MTFVTGILQGPDFERFEASLDWLETTGVFVEQFDPSTAQEEVAKVNESVVSRGRHLSRARLARTVGQGQAWERSVA